MLKVILMLALPCSHASFFATQHAKQHLRAHHVNLGKPSLLVLLGEQRPSCQCSFDDQCTCQGALRFMDCVKASCNSGDCQCIQTDGTNHFLESCSSMTDECPGIGLKCMPEQATCNDAGVAWHPKVKQDAVNAEAPEDSWKWKTFTPRHEGDGVSEMPEGDGVEAPPSVRDAERVPEKYVLHAKYTATMRALRSNTHRVFAQGVIITLVVLGMTIALATSANDHVATNTRSVINYVVVTFLGFFWLVTTITLFDYFKFSGVQEVCAYLVFTVLLLLASLLTSWRLRSNDGNVDIFNSIFPVLVMWCNGGLVETALKHSIGTIHIPKELLGHKTHLPAHLPVVDVLVVLIVLMIWYAVLTLLVHLVFQRYATTKGWGHEQENLITGGALAYGIVLWCHMAISGSYNSLEGLHHNSVPSLTVGIQILLALCFLAVSLRLLPIISKKSNSFASCSIGSNGYWKSRVCGVTQCLLKFLPCFSLMLSLGQLLLGDKGYFHNSVGARLLLLLASIAIAILMITICTLVPLLRRNSDVSNEMRGLLLCLAGFLVGTAWSGLLDNSINMMGKGKGYQDAFHVKLALTGFLTAFIFPVYCYFLKPLLMNKV